MSIGIALSGGGAKGAAHIGVLQALKEEKINVDYISGASSGSIVAALYASGYSPLNILSMFNTYCKQIADCDKTIPFKVLSTMFTGKITLKGLVNGDNLESIIYSYAKAKNIININQVKMPLAIPTVDLNTGEIIYFLNKYVPEYIPKRSVYDDTPRYIYSATLSKIVRASSSFPGVFEPKNMEGKLLIDGGVRINTPVSILHKMGADKVIAVSFDKNKIGKTSSTNIISVAMKAFDIMGHQVNEPELNKADFIIRPSMDNVSLLDCSKTNKLATQGYESAKASMSSIKEILGI
ncbi:MAG: patatin-like phospholipase family protein [Clostridia bacterium]